jgi:uncharacterized protein (DUF608 family)
VSNTLKHEGIASEPSGSHRGAGALSRRDFLRIASFASLSVPFWANRSWAAGEPVPTGVSHFVPKDKNLSAEWFKNLALRGTKEVFRGEELKFIGMPVGGIGSGQLYLCGDGTLGCWELFNYHEYRGTGELNYAPRTPDKPVDQGFAVIAEQDGRQTAKCLNRDGFGEVEFNGTYPIADVRYRDAGFPLDVSMEAFSPFIPLNAKDSALPATVFSIRMKNTSNAPVKAGCLGWLENAICLRTPEDVAGTRRTRRVSSPGRTTLVHSAEAAPPAQGKPERAPIVLQDFEGKDYGAWKTTGEAFGTAPAQGKLPGQWGVPGVEGKGLANSFLHADMTMGTLTSPPFTIERRYINFLVGGGNFAGIECVNLIIDGKVVLSATGNNDEELRWETWPVERYEGKEAKIEIVDKRVYPFGHICVDQVELSDTRRKRYDHLEKNDDFGTMALALEGECEAPESVAEAMHSLAGIRNARFVASDDEAYAFPEKRNAALLGKRVELQPGEERVSTFVLAWHFPNAPKGHAYAARFPDAPAVAQYALDNLKELAGGTRAWRDTYYDSTLPYWLLDRVHSTVSTLSTGTCYWWANGRFWAFEGVVSCPGTCTHVWNYAQAEARLFPELARSVREMQDFNPNGGGFHPDTGLVGFRGDAEYAADGQCGTVLKAYREHLNSANRDFLTRNWPNIKKALELCLVHDGNDDGVMEDEQPNTYDIALQGANSFVGGLYLAALRAGEEMALEMGETPFAAKLHAVFESGAKATVTRLWNGEYFVQDVDLAKFPQFQYGPGCLADQLFGQSWAHQVGLGYLYPKDVVKQGLESVWTYNWAPDVGPQNQAHPPLRCFAAPGEAGMLVATWPKSPYLEQGVIYKNEVWSGSEYQVAANMIWDGLVEKGLAICRGIHDRYHPSKRNPYNEVECGDHYARALASWGVLTALSGFDYHGPNGRLRFAPRLTPHDFKAAFTAAEGWGAFAQKREGSVQRDTIEIRRGRLVVKTLGFALEEKASVKSLQVKAGDGPVDATHEVRDGAAIITLPNALTLEPGRTLEVIITT